MHGTRLHLLGAIFSAGVVLVGSVSSLVISAWQDIPIGHFVEIAVALMASGFLYLVRQWIAKQEAADRQVMDTIREATEHQRAFEARVSEFMGLVKGHLGLHSEDSDPAIRSGHERRTQQDRRIIRAGGGD